PLTAQSYFLRDGREIKHADVTLRGGHLVRTIGAGAEISYPFSQVVRLDWPEPEEIAQARQLLAEGKGVPAEETITPVYNQFAPFSKLPGSWWSEAALIRARAILAQGKKDETERAVREIISSATDPDTVAAAQLLMARVQIMLKKPDIADAMLDELMSKDVSAELEARAALLRGDIAYDSRQFEKALEFYLQVPVFYGTEEALMPMALLGSARAYRGYGDQARAERAYMDIILRYPDSAEARTAKAESSKL